MPLLHIATTWPDRSNDDASLSLSLHHCDASPQSVKKESPSFVAYLLLSGVGGGGGGGGGRRYSVGAGGDLIAAAAATWTQKSPPA